MNNNALWLREKQLERYAQEIKAYCDSQNGDCRGCYFCIMNPQKGYRKAHGSYHIFQEQLSLTKWQQSFTVSASPLLLC